MRDRVKVACYVALYDPLVRLSLSGKAVSKVRDGVIGASVWPKSLGMFTKGGFPYGFQDHPKGFLYYAVVNGWDT